MNSLQDTPSQKVVPGDIWTYGKEKRRKFILEISESIISSFTGFNFHGMTITSNDHDLFQEHSIQLLSSICITEMQSKKVMESGYLHHGSICYLSL